MFKINTHPSLVGTSVTLEVMYPLSDVDFLVMFLDGCLVGSLIPRTHYYVFSLCDS
jgi:hypothetical protein